MLHFHLYLFITLLTINFHIVLNKSEDDNLSNEIFERNSDKKLVDSNSSNQNQIDKSAEWLKLISYGKNNKIKYLNNTNKFTNSDYEHYNGSIKSEKPFSNDLEMNDGGQEEFALPSQLRFKLNDDKSYLVTESRESYKVNIEHHESISPKLKTKNLRGDYEEPDGDYDDDYEEVIGEYETSVDILDPNKRSDLDSVKLSDILTDNKTLEKLSAQIDETPAEKKSLAFVFDTTGSMWDDLLQLRTGAEKIMRAIKERDPFTDYNYVLVPFHDPVVGPVTVTDDQNVLLQKLQEINVYGGGDCPEMSLGGIKEAIKHSHPYSHIYVLTDATALDHKVVTSILDLVQLTQNKIVFILTGDCGDRSVPNYIVYKQIAEASSGQVFHLDKADVNQVLDYIRDTLDTKRVGLLAVDDKKAANPPRVHKVDVDEALEQLVVSVSGDNPSVSFVPPSGNKPKNVTNVLSLDKIKVVNVAKPEPGRWGIKVGSDSAHSVRFSALSDLRFHHGFSILPPNSIDDTTNRPLIGVKNYLIIKPLNASLLHNVTSVELIGTDGQIITNIALQPSYNGSEYISKKFQTPNYFFNLGIKGFDQNGNIFLRTTSTAIKPQHPDKPYIEMNDIYVHRISTILKLPCKVKSLIPVEVQWFRNNKPISEVFNLQQSGVVFWIQNNPTKDLEGKYVCRAKNIAGRIEKSTQLFLLEPPVLKIPENQIIEISEGTQLYLPCTVLSGNPRPSTHWLRNNKQIKSENEVIILRNGTLIIKNTFPRHQGKYQCAAMNKAGTVTFTVEVIVRSPPKFVNDMDKTSFTTVVGQHFSLQCEAVGNPDPFIYWSVENLNVTSVKETYTNTRDELVFKNIKTTDEGSYTCTAFNPVGTIERSYHITVLDVPHIQIKDKYVHHLNTPLEIPCHINSRSPFTAWWFKNGVPVSKVYNLEKSGEIYFIQESATRDMEGMYSCIANNAAGTTEKSTQLTLVEAPTLKQPDKLVFTIIQGNPLHIPCTVISGKPKPDIHWFKDRNNIQSEKEFEILKNGSLIIKNVLPIHRGSYQCRAINDIGEDMITIDVHVQTPPTFVDKDTTTSHTVNIGQQLSLHCKAKGDPKPAIIWLKNGHPISYDDYKFINEESTLTLKSAKQEDEDVYTCLAENFISSINKTIFVTVLDVPHIQIKDKYVHLLNTSLKIFCHINSRSPFTAWWFKDGVPVSKVYNLEKSGEIYFIQESVTRDMEGTYSCIANNTAGTTENSTQLTLVEAPVLKQPDKLVFTIIQGNPLHIPCTVISGKPKPDIHWFKDRNNIQSEKEVEILKNGSLIIKNVLPIHQGSYQCRAINDIGEDMIRIDVYVQIPPKFIDEDKTTSHTINIGQQLSLHCKAYGDPKPEFKWLKNGNPIDYDTNTFVNEETTLILNNAKQKDEGVYTCIAENIINNINKTVSVTVLDVPHIEIKNKYIHLLNTSLKIPCHINSRSPFTAWWFKDDVLVSKVFNLERSDEIYFIQESVTRDMEGIYSCIANNTAGTTEKSTQLILVEPPFLRQPDKLVFTIIQGNPLHIPCTVINGKPKPDINWFKDKINIKSEKEVEILKNGSLIIKNVQPIHRGSYQCRAINNIGEDMITIDVHVQSPPKFIDEVNTISNTVNIGQQISLQCKAKGDPKPEFKWLKNGNPISYNDYKFVNEENTLNLNNVTLEDGGVYTCVVKNLINSINKTISLSVIDIPHITLSDKFFIPVNKLLNIFCYVESRVPFTVQWYKNDSPISEIIKLEKSDKVYWTQKFALKEMEGKYICRANNEAGTNEKSTELVLTEAPLLKKLNDSVITVLSEKQLTLNCIVLSGNPKPSIYWLKNSEKIVNANGIEILNNNSLLIKNASSITHRGIYQCITVNDIGEDIFTVEIQVQSLPSFDNTDNNFYEVNVGNNLSLRCDVKGEPKPLVTWLKNNSTIIYNTEKYVDKKNALVIKNMKQNDEGDYTCIAENVVGTVKQNITVTVIDVPSVKLKSKYIYPMKTSLMLKCDVESQVPVIVQWYKNDASISQIFNLTNNGSVKWTQNNATKNTEGVYVCKAQNKAGITEKSTELILTEAPVLKKPDDLIISTLPGMQLHVPCIIIAGNPNPSVYWMKNNVNIKPGNSFQLLKNNSLLIKNASAIHEGTYTCIAVNNIGNDQFSINLKVQSLPKFSDTSTGNIYTAISGDRFSLNCEAQGEPKPLVSWVKDGLIILYDTDKYVNNDNELHFENLKESDSGIYVCIAYNTVGSINKTNTLVVMVPPKIIIIGDNTISTMQGELVTLQCPVYAKPKPNIQWLLNLQPMSMENKMLNDNNTLRFIANVNNSGIYECVAENKFGKEKREWLVMVLVPPVIQLPGDETVSVNLGSNLTLECAAVGFPNPIIYWNRQGSISSNNSGLVNLESEKLIINNISYESAGPYICNAENEAGFTQKVFHLVVNVPPKIMDDLPKEIVLIEGEQFTIPCNVNGNPTPKVSWKKNEKPIGQQNIHINIHKTLAITSVTSDMTGVYTCEASNIHGKDSKEYNLQVIAPPNMITSGISNITEIIEGNSVQLECPVKKVFPLPDITWTKNGIFLSETKNAIASFYNVTSATTLDTGEYVCTVKNTVGSARHKILLTVLTKPQIITLHSTHLVGIVGEDIRMYCSATSTPNPAIRWLRNGDMIGKENILLIENINKYHEGYYICEASNIVGKEEKKFYLDVLVPPELIGSDNEKIEVLKNTSLVITCNAKGFPQPDIEWIHPSTVDKSTVAMSGQLLRIINVDYGHAGVYKCAAVNKAGVVTKRIKVTVLEKPIINVTQNKNITVKIDSKFQIECIVTGKPKPSINWYHDGQLLTDEDFQTAFTARATPVNSNITNYSLDVRNAKPNLSGIYKCIATNKVGQSEEQFKINIHWPPEFLDYMNNEGINYIEGVPISLVCPVKGNPVPVITWIKNDEIEIKNDTGISISTDGSTLHIDHTNMNHSAKYICVAKNEVGKVKRLYNITILVAPKIDKNYHSDQPVFLTTGDTLRLQCIVSSYPLSEIIWLKSNNAIDSSTYKNNNSTLVIKNTTVKDTGQYTCIAINVAGATEQSFNVIIQEPPEFINNTTSVSNMSVLLHKAFILECDAKGVPKPIIDWYKNNTVLIDIKESEHIKMDNSRIQVKNAGISDEGEYVCSAKNTVGIIYKRYFVKILKPAKWSEWSNWTECSVSCGRGQKIRKRICTVDPEVQPCEGPSNDTTDCFASPCPINGGWSEWSNWSICSKPCGNGSRSRRRTCDNPLPQYNGKSCTGHSIMVEKCSLSACDKEHIKVILNVKGSLNGKRIDNTTIAASFSQKGNETSINTLSDDLIQDNDGWFPYMTFLVTPVSRNIEENEFNEYQQDSVIAFSTGEEMILKHTGHGKNEDGNIEVEIEVFGDVPVIEREAEIIIEPFSEEFVEIGPGEKIASTNNNFKVNGEDLGYLWNSNISYKNREESTPMYLVEKISAQNIKTKYNSKNKQLSYIASTSIYKNKDCPNGFEKSSETQRCVDIDECKLHGSCHSTQLCENTIGSFRCYCMAGFRSVANGRQCLDINECSLDIHQCSHKCENTPGSYKCLCPIGMLLAYDLKTCVTIGHKVPDVLAYIRFLEKKLYQKKQPPSRTSSTKLSRYLRYKEIADCVSGYAMKNAQCEDVDECSTDKHDCDDSQICLNTKGSYLCIPTPCPDNYQHDIESRSCLLFCGGYHKPDCSEGALISQSINYITLSVKADDIKINDSLTEVEMKDIDGKILTHNFFSIIDSTPDANFSLYTENNRGVIYIQIMPVYNRVHRITIIGNSYDAYGSTILYSTKFIVYIYVTDL